MLPLNSGENNSMNPGEQNQNNFGQPGPIMSSANDTTASSPTPSPVSSGQPSSNTSRFFGGASRYKGPKTRSASTPEYFSQPAPTPGPIAMSAPLPEYKERKSKTPIFIAIGAVALIAIIVVAVVLLPGAIGGGASEEKIVDLTNLMKEYGESAVFYDQEVREDLRLEVPTKRTVEYYGKYKKELTDNLQGLKTFREKLNDYKNTKAVIKSKTDKGETTDVDKKVDELKKLLDERMSIYEKYASVMIPYADIYATEGGSDSIKSFEDAAGDKGKKVAKKLSSYFSAYKKYSQVIKNDSCVGSTDACATAYNDYYAALDIINNDSDFREIGKDIANKDFPPNDVMSLVELIKEAEKKTEDKKEEVKQ